MPKYEPITDATPLPKEKTGYEHETRDLKLKTELTTPYHMAKDVAAFANYLGGNLIIGAKENAGAIDFYQPLTLKDVGKTQDAFSKAVLARCEPQPVVLPVRKPHGQGWVLVLNVEPHLSSLVGVRVTAEKKDGPKDYGGPAFTFPMRTMTDTIHLTPEQLHMYVEPRVRRTMILLGRIGQHDKVRSYLPSGMGMEHLGVEVREAENVVVFRGPHGEIQRSLALDTITTVYREGTTNGFWIVQG